MDNVEVCNILKFILHFKIHVNRINRYISFLIINIKKIDIRLLNCIKIHPNFVAFIYKFFINVNMFKQTTTTTKIQEPNTCHYRVFMQHLKSILGVEFTIKYPSGLSNAVSNPINTTKYVGGNYE